MQQSDLQQSDLKRKAIQKRKRYMRVNIKNITQKDEEQVIIECVEVTPEITDIYSYITHRGREIAGKSADGQLKSVGLLEVYYFEALDEKVFAYTEDEVLELKMRLYEAEQEFAKQHFVRCSKSIVLNLMQLEGISPALNGRFFAHMKNGEKLIISRQYAGKLKKAVMGGAGNE